jgi:hypothetical protein
MSENNPHGHIDGDIESREHHRADDDKLESRQHHRADDDKLETLCTEFADFRMRIEPVIEVWEALTGLAKFLRWVGIVAKWIAAVAAGFAIVWAALTHKWPG